MADTPNVRPIDAVTASVIQGALENIAVEMGWKLMRMSYSSIIRESEDFGAAIIDRHGRQLCESKHSTPLQSGPIPGYVKGMNRILEERGQTLNEATSSFTTPPITARATGRTLPSSCRSSTRARWWATRSPPRTISISARSAPAAAASSTRWMLTPRGSSSRRSRPTTGASPTRRSGT